MLRILEGIEEEEKGKGRSHDIDPRRMAFKFWVTGETIYDHSTIEDSPARTFEFC